MLSIMVQLVGGLCDCDLKPCFEPVSKRLPSVVLDNITGGRGMGAPTCGCRMRAGTESEGRLWMLGVPMWMLGAPLWMCVVERRLGLTRPSCKNQWALRGVLSASRTALSLQKPMGPKRRFKGFTDRSFPAKTNGP